MDVRPFNCSSLNDYFLFDFSCLYFFGRLLFEEKKLAEKNNLLSHTAKTETLPHNKMHREKNRRERVGKNALKRGVLNTRILMI
jgi:hypothetical protein